MTQAKDLTLSVCMIVKNNEQTIEAVYNSFKGIADEWIVVDTGSTDKTVKIAKRLGAKVFTEGDRFTKKLDESQVEFFGKYGVEVEVGEPIFDFGAARNFSFEKATKDYVMWIDSDDILVGSERLKKIMNSNLDKKEQLGISLLYQYETDEKGNSVVEHWRERILPNNGTAKWNGIIHEIIIPSEETSYIQVVPQDSYILHANAHVGGQDSANRNTKNLLYDLFSQGENPDPRTLYYLGEAFYKKRDFKRAIDFFEKYVELSGWDEEQCIAATRLSDLYIILGDGHKGLEWATKATQFRNDFPQAHIQVAQAFFNLERYEDCIRNAQFAIQLEEPETLTLVHKKNLQISPFLLLAESHYKLGQFEEALKATNSVLAVDEDNEYALRLNAITARTLEENEVEASIIKLNEYLRKNEEPLKAKDLMECVPATMLESPLMRDLWKKTQRTVEHLEDEELYKSLYEDELGETPHEIKDINDVAKIERVKCLLASLINNKSEVVLDTSCGDGRIPLLLGSLGYQVTAIDCSQKMIDFAKEQQRKLIKKYPQVANVKFECKSLQDLGYGDSKVFDCVYSFETIEHVEDPFAFLWSMKMLTSPDGFIALSTPNGPYDKGCNEELKEFKPMKHVRVYTINSLKEELDSFGFDVVQNIPHENGRIIYAEAKVKEVSKQSIAIICGQSSEIWGAKSVYNGGCGGSEEAVIYVSKELSKLGYDVTIFNETLEQGTFDGVTWKHHTLLDEDEFDIAIVWRLPHLLDDYRFSAKKTYLWLHDVPQRQWFTEKRLARIDKIMVLSEYHRFFLPEIQDDKFLFTGNGVEVTQFYPRVERNEKKVIYTSSYDRGLEHLLDIWPAVKDAVPEAELHIYYGWGGFDKLRVEPRHIKWKSMMIEKMESLDGIFEHGRIGQDELALEMKNSSVLAYPCHFEEISCITVMKAQFAGCIPLTTNYGALIETNLTEFKVDGNPREDEGVMVEFQARLIELLKNPPKREVRRDIVKNALDKFTWSKVANEWSQDFNIGDVNNG